MPLVRLGEEEPAGLVVGTDSLLSLLEQAAAVAQLWKYRARPASSQAEEFPG